MIRGEDGSKHKVPVVRLHGPVPASAGRQDEQAARRAERAVMPPLRVTISGKRSSFSLSAVCVWEEQSRKRMAIAAPASSGGRMASVENGIRDQMCIKMRAGTQGSQDESERSGCSLLCCAHTFFVCAGRRAGISPSSAQTRDRRTPRLEPEVMRSASSLSCAHCRCIAPSSSSPLFLSSLLLSFRPSNEIFV